MHENVVVDYYQVLKVNPDCDARILELAYHYFAKMYHPDNQATADAEKFSEVIEAYRALRNPEQRAAYDRTYSQRDSRSAYQFPPYSDFAIDEKTVVNDAETQDKILFALYKRRREHASDAGVIGWFIQEMVDCSEEHFEFHIWYLKSKGFIEVTEQGTIAATVQGVDKVLSASRLNLAETLRIRQSHLPES